MSLHLGRQLRDNSLAVRVDYPRLVRALRGHLKIRQIAIFVRTASKWACGDISEEVLVTSMRTGLGEAVLERLH